jgi:hypothetical protein
MGTKQVKFEFLIVAANQVSANVTIAFNGVQKWSGPLANTNDSIPGPDTPDAPYSNAIFDLDIEDTPVPWPNPIGTMSTAKDITITVTGGSAIFKTMSANYGIYWQEKTPPTDPATFQVMPGISTEFNDILPTAQPTWNDVPLLDRFNFADGANGPMLVEPDELLEFPVQIQWYNDSLPTP